MDKKQTMLSGRSLVLDQLFKRGYVSGQAEDARIPVTNPNTGNHFELEVRTTQKPPAKSGIFGSNYEWFMSKKHETLKANNLVYCFVLLTEGNRRPRFFLVPSGVVVEYVKTEHKYWLAQPRYREVKSKDIRRFRIRLDDTSHGLSAITHENKWELFDR
jgi:hypothetical protein